MMMINKLALILSIIGGVNWGLVGIFNFDLVAWIFGGQYSIFSKIIYILVAICSLICISFFFENDECEKTKNNV